MAHTPVVSHERQELQDALSSTRPHWRQVCQLAAQAAAEEEAYIEWKMASGDPLPFNYRWEHVQQVVRTAKWLAGEMGADLLIVEPAAWLHDVRKVEPDHAVAGALAAGPILIETNYPPDKVEFVCDVIAQHEGLSRDRTGPLEPVEAAVLWDADKLTKLGVQALAYNLGTPRIQGRTLRERFLNLYTFATTVLPETVASMNTPPAQRLAARRHAEMLAALEAWSRDAELGRSE